MSRDQRQQLATGAASAFALVLILAGPPVFLVTTVGWPLPTTVPSVDEIRTAITVGVENDVVVKALALVAWAAWVLLAISVVAQIAAMVRGRAARVLPGMPGRVQAGIGRLVASAMLSVTSAGPVVGSGSLVAAVPAIELVVADAAVATVTVPDATPQPVSTVPATSAAVDQTPAALADTAVDAPTVIVGRHDSYWAIAERALGDPLRWSEIRDLNVGRTMGDGTVLPPTSDHPQPGWALVLPLDANAPVEGTTDPSAPGPSDDGRMTGPAVVTVEPEPTPAAAPGDSPPVGPLEITVQSGDNLWQLAENHLAVTGQPTSPADVVPTWLRLIDTNRSRLVEPDDPDLIYPGQILVLPAADTAGQAPAIRVTDASEPGCDPPSDSAPTSTGPAQHETDSGSGLGAVTDSAPPERLEPAEPHDQATSAPTSAEPDPAGRPDHDVSDKHRATPGGDGPSPVTVAAGLVSTALAAGVIEGLRRRRLRARREHPDAIPAPTIHPSLHQQLAAQAGGDTQQQLRHALAQLALGIATMNGTCRPRIVQQGPDHLDVLLDQPTPRPPTGWDADADGRIWTRTTDGLAADRCTTLPADHLDPTPLLLSLGAADDSGQLYLDLEAASVVALIGDRETAHGVARGMVTELANSALAQAAQIVVIGEIGGPLHRLDRVLVHQAWNEATDQLTSWAGATREAIAAAGWPNSFIGRSHGVWADALRPLLVVAATAPGSPDVLDELLAASPAAAAVVVVGEAPAGALRIDCQPDRLELPQLGLTCQPRPITTDLVEGVVDLLDQATGRRDSVDRPGTWSDVDPAPGGTEAPTDHAVDGQSDEGYEDPPYEVLVRVLGDIEIDGTKVPPTPKQTAILAYLALHGSTDADRLAEALWATSPGTGAHRKRLGNAIGECRRILDSDHLPPASDGRYKLGPAVLTDTALWDHRVKAASGQPPDIAAKTLQGAIDLVRGPVFTYRTADQDSYAWVDIENLVAIWEKKITSVTQHLAELYLDLGQPDRAVAIAEHILRAVPTDTAVTETLMRAHAAHGDLRSLKRVYQAHVNALEQLDLDQPAESTTTLFDELRNSANGQANAS